MKAFQRLLVAAPAAALLPAVMAPLGAMANEQYDLNLDSVQEYSVAQGATIRDFSDVYPTDWAYKALAKLVDTYGCVAGFPDGTFRGQQPITRFEMAAILNSCLDSISAKMSMMDGDMPMEDKSNLDHLVASFEEELITLKGTVDGLDAKVTELEANQFSTTTKAEFEIVTDFTYFSAENEEARGGTPKMETVIVTDAVPEVSDRVKIVGAAAPVGAEGETRNESMWHPGLNAGNNEYRDFSAADSKYLLLQVARLNEDGDPGTSEDHVFVTDGDGKYKFIDSDSSTEGTQVGAGNKITRDNFNTATANNSAIKAFLILRPEALYYQSAGIDTDNDTSDDVYSLVPEDRSTLTEAQRNTINTRRMLDKDIDLDEIDPEFVKYIITAAQDAVTEEREVEGELDHYEASNSGIALSSSVEIAFDTSFTGSDKLTFKLEGDMISMEDHYLKMGNFYDIADNGDAGVKFTGFKYENTYDLGGMMTNLVVGTDVDDVDPIVGLETYYEASASGYDGYGVGDFGGTGIGFNMELISGDAGTMTASASYSVDAGHAADQRGKKGIFGEETDRSFMLGFNWDGALFGGNEAMFTVAYRNIDHNSMATNQNDWNLVAGAYFTDTLSLSGQYSFGNYDPGNEGKNRVPLFNFKTEYSQWMLALNMDDAIFPGNSAGIAYGSPESLTTNQPDGYQSTKVLELYYKFAVNDNFEVPIYLDFISNAGQMSNTNAFGIAIRPTLTF